MCGWETKLFVPAGSSIVEEVDEACCISLCIKCVIRFTEERLKNVKEK